MSSTALLENMNKKIRIVEDGIVEASNLRIILGKAGYYVSGIADSYERGDGLAYRQKLRQKPSTIPFQVTL